jgi:Protein of unknown function (DUF3037)
MDKNTGVNYEYQLLRYRHDLASGEFVNVGLVYFDPQTRFLCTRMTERYGRLSDFFGNVSGVFLLRGLKTMQKEFSYIKTRLEKELDFNQFQTVAALTTSVLPKDDNTLFFSETFKGFHFNHEKSFDTLYDRLIGQYSEEATEQRHDDNYAWKKVYKHFFDVNNITPQLKDHNVVTATDVIEFEHAAKNGVWHCFQPISFDLKKKGDIKEKIYRWAGIIGELQTAEEPLHVYLLSLLPDDPQLQHIIEQKLTLNQPNLTVQLIKEEDALAMITSLKPLLTEH